MAAMTRLRSVMIRPTKHARRVTSVTQSGKVTLPLLALMERLGTEERALLVDEILHRREADLPGRLRQMGEEAWRVHCCGAPGLDRFGSLDYLPRPALAERLGLPLRRPAVLVTFHPPTLGGADVAAQAEELLAALARVDGTLVLTYPAADTGSHAIIERLERFAASTPCARVARSLGDDVYASLLREADVMVGNSSSGLIEGPTFALPVVNIGDRQRGRLRAANVLDVGHGRDEILAGIRRALDPPFRRSLQGLVNPYGDGHAAPRIARVLREVELGPRLLVKRFADAPSNLVL